MGTVGIATTTSFANFTSLAFSPTQMDLAPYDVTPSDVIALGDDDGGSGMVPFGGNELVGEAMQKCVPLVAKVMATSGTGGGGGGSQDIEQVKFLAYGVIMPILVGLGLLGDIFNLIVLTRPNMTGVAYVYMRGKY
ncbi:uncharacterized protein LOC143027947 [Oratosquilla oratoria]|uniref:uncharacterized protein LOC143027947 n=1 Tax=Oratosquilla oratoria TaxID=337810 RepID=UPI003F774520